jgi:endoglucanase
LLGDEGSRTFWQEYRENYIAQEDIQAIAGYGFNSVRVPLHYGLFKESESEGFALLDALVGWCKEYDMYVIFDMHCAPGGQTGANIDDSAGDTPELWSSQANKAETKRIWRSIALRYAREDHVAGYDLLNEPLPEKFSRYKTGLEPLYREIISEIRAVDDKHIIFIEGANWATDFSMFPAPPGANIVYSFHKYWDQADTGSIEKYLTLSKSQNVPLWLGETGENSNQWYGSCVQLMEANGIGWCFWPWKKVGSANAPFMVVKPADFDAVIEYTKGGKAPGRREAEKAFTELLENIEFDKCVKNAGVIESLLKRIP